MFRMSVFAFKVCFRGGVARDGDVIKWFLVGRIFLHAPGCRRHLNSTEGALTGFDSGGGARNLGVTMLKNNDTVDGKQ